MRPVLAIAICFTFSFFSNLQAENWPQFRGPTGQGHSTAVNLPAQWSTTENVDWKVSIPGKGWSSPIYLDGKLYLTTAIPLSTEKKSDHELSMICLDAKSGKLLWQTKVFDQIGKTTERIHGKNSYASPTPIFNGKHIFVHFGTQGTAALDLKGNILWTNRELKYQMRHGNGGSPALVDDLLVISCDGMDEMFVVALSQQDGKIRWKKSRRDTKDKKTFSFCTPLVINVNGKQQVISPGTNQVTAFNPQDGSEIWTVDYKGYSVIPRPVYANGLLFIATSYNKPWLLAIDPSGEGNVTESHVPWKMQRGAPHTPSVLAVADELYFVSDNGIATCVDARKGTVHWTKRLGGKYSASPVFADGRIYFQSEQGETTVIQPAKEYTELAKNSLDERTLASFAIADSSIFIRTEKNLYRMSK